MDINQIIKAKTITTIITPDQTPALKIPSTNSQLVNVVHKMAIAARGIYLFMDDLFNFILNSKSDEKVFTIVGIAYCH